MRSFESGRTYNVIKVIIIAVIITYLRESKKVVQLRWLDNFGTTRLAMNESTDDWQYSILIKWGNSFDFRFYRIFPFHYINLRFSVFFQMATWSTPTARLDIFAKLSVAKCPWNWTHSCGAEKSKWITCFLPPIYKSRNDQLGSTIN